MKIYEWVSVAGAGYQRGGQVALPVFSKAVNDHVLEHRGSISTKPAERGSGCVIDTRQDCGQRVTTQSALITNSAIGVAVCSHVMRTKTVAFLLTSLAFSAMSAKAIAHDASLVAAEVKKAASESLQIHQKSGISGLKNAVSECWKVPRDYCLYLDAASHRIAVGATHAGIVLDEYFYAASVSKRGHSWLSLKGRGQEANDQFLQAVDQVMVHALVRQRDKMIDDRP